ncbi:MAG TPA: GntR family transcriptional regulator [Conexibacter sp.]|nr:GntR family transcriptional regulator [Conexibacter sp.]
MAQIPSFEPVRRVRAHELVVAQVQDLILRGEVAPGSHLPAERKLMTELGVSRAMLREGLRIAESMGLIEVRHGEQDGPLVVARPERGVARVLTALHETAVTTDAELIETAALLSGEVAARAAVRRPDVRALAAAVRAAAPEQRGDAEAALHDAVGAACGNPALAVLAAGARVACPGLAAAVDADAFDALAEALLVGDEVRSREQARRSVGGS